jgi:hypothetical protein
MRTRSAPTWFGGVQALVNDACAGCHGAVPFDPRIAGFRLDRSVAGDAIALDAHDFLPQIRSTAATHGPCAERQPPAGQLVGELHVPPEPPLQPTGMIE